jgi:hypothetical protein
MKKLIATAAIIMTLATGVFADEEKGTRETKCLLVQQIAKSIMGLRQSGTDFDELWSASSSSFSREVIIDAFKMPAFSTEEMQKKVVSDFKNKWFIYCWEVLEGEE